ncbi:MAG TPA: hypothetical protein VJS15_02810, partial [Allosphingosinicella sp.]|nr:hypothetical protein [Allosphingosinicella sp.]
FKREKIQGGILANYGNEAKPVQRAALLLMRITDAVRARAFLKQLAPPAKTEGKAAAAEAPPKAKGLLAQLRVQPETEEEGAAVEGDTFLNLAFTRHGLINIGLPAAEYDRLPQEFREGMEERAGLLGDVRDNHPRRWKLPPRYRAPAPDGAAPPKADLAETPLELTEVDLILMLRTLESDGAFDAIVEALASNPECGLELLAVEPMRPAPRRDDLHGTEHFGFRDGISQPKPVLAPDPANKDEVPLGEIFLGYSNARADGPPAPSDFLDNGTFMVLRKLSQNVGGLRTFVRTETARLNEEFRQEARQAGTAKGVRGEEPTVFITEEDLYAKMMGRDRDGRVSLKTPTEGNTFNYDKDDPHGTSCPFQSHIRRANPRTSPDETNGRPTPRILRRGHSYGPGYDGCGEAEKEAERGVFFMAYNASIAEQYEVIQRWINGGNSTKVASWQSDPLMGVGQHGDPRTFRFLHKEKTCRVNIPNPFVKLCWGAYLFVPSIDALRAIGTSKPDLRTAGQADELEQARRGEEIVSRLLALAAEGPEGRVAAGAAWKSYLEDFAAKDPGEKDEATAVWAAIRLNHAGALKVPYGVVPPRETPRDAVLVASKELVMRVFADPGCKYSMSGQMTRMKQSFGEIFLGMDKGPVYEAKSKVNDILFGIKEQDAFELARKCAMSALAVSFRVKEEVEVRECKIDLRWHFITSALAGVCHAWFGIPDAPPPASPTGDNFVDPWGWSWEPAETRKPRCPGDYMATSRFCFYPDPIPRVRAFGKSHGQALRKAVGAYFDKVRGTPALTAWISKAMAELELPDGTPVYPGNDDLARNVIGVMTGFLPPADGCMRWALYEWLEDKTLPRVQHDLTAASGDAFARANKALRPWLERAMQKRPAPDLLWRTATRDHRLGEVDVAADDRVFIGIVSALSEDQAAGITDVYPIFGGERGRADSPLHACPAHKAAMGTMLGILSALLDNFRVEPLPATMLVAISEPSEPMRALIESPKVEKTAAMILAATATPPAPRKDTVPPAPPKDAAGAYDQAKAGPDAPVSGRGDAAGEGDEEGDEPADPPFDEPVQ